MLLPPPPPPHKNVVIKITILQNAPPNLKNDNKCGSSILFHFKIFYFSTLHDNVHTRHCVLILESPSIYFTDLHHPSSPKSKLFI